MFDFYEVVLALFTLSILATAGVVVYKIIKHN
jgi:hypothetical protein